MRGIIADMSDSVTALEQAFAAGERSALSQAFSRWGALLYTIALRGTGDVDAATEITADTFATVWQHGYQRKLGPLKQILECTARKLTTEQAASAGPIDGVLDRVVVRDELTGMAEPTRSVLRLALLQRPDISELAERAKCEPTRVPELMLTGINSLHARLEYSRGK